jgi:D-sedoheptulose 7-phosphate isomerase
VTRRRTTIDLEAYFGAGFEEHLAVAAASRGALGGAFVHLVECAAEAVAGGGKILLFGNGGSAADAQHLATELTVRFGAARAPIAALALTTDTSALTAIGNDFGFDHLFSRQIEALGRGGDLALAFTGRGGGDLAGLADPLLAVPSDATARIQEMHITLGQLFCGALERRLGLV